MKRFRSTVVAAAVLAAVAASVAASAAQSGVTWLVFVDDLHLDFRNTGRNGIDTRIAEVMSGPGRTFSGRHKHEKRERRRPCGDG